MTKTELIKEAANKLGATEKSVSETMNCLLETIAQALEKGEAVRLLGFGTFERKERAARSGFNPAQRKWCRSRQVRRSVLRQARS